MFASGKVKRVMNSILYVLILLKKVFSLNEIPGSEKRTDEISE